MAEQEFVYQTTILIRPGKRMIIVRGVGSAGNPAACWNQDLPDVFDTIKDIFSPFLMMVF